MADSKPKRWLFSRPNFDLFLVSGLILFLELALIRWLPAHVLYITFFTNTVLLASFLGISLGCMAAKLKRDFLAWTPCVLAGLMTAGQIFGRMRGSLQKIVDVGHQTAPEVVFFGAEAYRYDLAKITIPLEVICGFFFLVVTFCFIGLGQKLGLLFAEFPSRLRAYTVNIAGSLIGIAVFTSCSWLHLPPFWWFLPVVAALMYFSWPDSAGRQRTSIRRIQALASILILVMAAATSWNYWSLEQLAQGRWVRGEHYWSPYYRINYAPAPTRSITVNLISHQGMIPLAQPVSAYALPYLLRRDSGGPPFKDVLIIGAGSGNDVSRALQWGAQHVDAVEIDPVIQDLGRREHPDRPYQDSRVRVYINDGRNFLKAANKKYDLIIYALLDSLVLHSSLSSIRLESYLFTEEAFSDAKRLLKPDGLLVTYNSFRQGWVVARILQELAGIFGSAPVVIALPYQPVITPGSNKGFIMLMAGHNDSIREAFQRHGAYAIRKDTALTPDSPYGFSRHPRPPEADQWERFGPAQVIAPDNLRNATDDWPFLYLRHPMIPNISWRGMALMGGLSMLLLMFFSPPERRTDRLSRFDAPMFFLGAGFMLVEAKAVVHMALLFGSTWVVNSMVFFSILLVVLAANLLVLKFKPGALWPFYLGLFASLVLSWAIPAGFFLGIPRFWQIAGSSLLIGAPIFFGGIIFAILFDERERPERAFGFNVGGALLGGLAENFSMLVGFQQLTLLALSFYVLSWLSTRLFKP